MRMARASRAASWGSPAAVTGWAAPGLPKGALEEPKAPNKPKREEDGGQRGDGGRAAGGRGSRAAPGTPRRGPPASAAACSPGAAPRGRVGRGRGGTPMADPREGAQHGAVRKVAGEVPGAARDAAPGPRPRGPHNCLSLSGLEGGGVEGDVWVTGGGKEV